MARWIRASYSDMNDASRAIDNVTALGYGKEDLSVVMSAQTRERFDARSEPGVGDTGHISRAATGGGVLGAALGAILATTTVTGAAAATILTGGLAAPFVVGPLAAALAGLAGGSAIGALVGAAGWEEDRETVERDIDNGAVIVAVNARTGEEAAVENALHSGMATAVGSTATAPAIDGSASGTFGAPVYTAPAGTIRSADPIVPEPIRTARSSDPYVERIDETPVIERRV